MEKTGWGKVGFLIKRSYRVFLSAYLVLILVALAFVSGEAVISGDLGMHRFRLLVDPVFWIILTLLLVFSYSVWLIAAYFGYGQKNPER